MRRTSAQLALDLRDPPRWGGRRAGAGRKRGPNPRMRHRSRERFAARYPCHVTVKVRDDVPSLRSVKLVREFERSFGARCERGSFRLVHYSLQGDHAHFLVEAAGRAALGRGMKSLGARLARAVNRVFGRRGPVLADRYHLRVLRTPREVRHALAYVLLNARRHARKARWVSRRARTDPASSGRWFDGWKKGTAAPAPDAGAGARPAVAPGRSWLVRRGWRRYGLIDPCEVPGRSG